jgi:hypothetical protein
MKIFSPTSLPNAESVGEPGGTTNLASGSRGKKRKEGNQNGESVQIAEIPWSGHSLSRPAPSVGSSR